MASHPSGSDFAPGLTSQVHNCEGPGLTNSGLGPLGPAGKPGCPQWIRTQFPGLLLFIQPHSLDALIGCFKFHLPFSVFTLVFLLGSRLLTISNWIPLGLRSPSTSNTDSRILSLLTPPYPVYQISIKDSTFHQVSQASTYSHLPLIFFSPTLHLTHQKKFF